MRDARAGAIEGGRVPDAVVDLVADGSRTARTLFDVAEHSGALTFQRLEEAIARCAEQGVPIEEVHLVIAEALESAHSADTAWLHTALRRATARAYHPAGRGSTDGWPQRV
ncbi:hypothetical protein ACWDSJ_35825 [Nocardia sp. NPDC003482]